MFVPNPSALLVRGIGVRAINITVDIWLNTSASLCALGGVYFNGKCYYFYNEPKEHADALLACNEANADLVTVLDQNINNFLSETLFSLYNGGKRSS